MRRALLLLLLSGCGSSEDLVAASADLRSVILPAQVVPVPLVQQKTDYSCGDAATLALLRYWKHEKYKQVPETALYGPLGTTQRDGTEPDPMAAFLDGEAGLSAEVRHTSPAISDLERAIDRGEPPIVDIEAWQNGPPRPWSSDWIDGHYVVLIGYDDARFYFMDPSTARHYAFIPRSELADRWHDVLGKRQVHTQHLAIFVHSTVAGWQPDHPLPPRATPID